MWPPYTEDGKSERAYTYRIPVGDKCTHLPLFAVLPSSMMMMIVILCPTLMPSVDKKGHFPCPNFRVDFGRDFHFVLLFVNVFTFYRKSCRSGIESNSGGPGKPTAFRKPTPGGPKRGGPGTGPCTSLHREGMSRNGAMHQFTRATEPQRPEFLNTFVVQDPLFLNNFLFRTPVS